LRNHDLPPRSHFREPFCSRGKVFARPRKKFKIDRNVHCTGQSLP